MRNCEYCQGSFLGSLEKNDSLHYIRTRLTKGTYKVAQRIEEELTNKNCLLIIYVG